MSGNFIAKAMLEAMAEHERIIAPCREAAEKTKKAGRDQLSAFFHGRCETQKEVSKDGPNPRLAP